VSYSTLRDNSAPLGQGGGIYNLGVSLVTVSHSTLVNNSAWLGGGIYSRGNLLVSNSTLAGKQAGFGGGAIYIEHRGRP
jgi:hypothetical protein